MLIPDYYLRKPAVSRESHLEFQQLYDAVAARNDSSSIEYKLMAPKWQFLSWLADTQNVLLHGSANPDIRLFEPRQSIDSNEFGNRRAVYAASDGIWATFFAVVDRARVSSLVNTCCRIYEEGEENSEAASTTYYYFSVDEQELPSHPWRNGTVYLLPRDTFLVQQPERIDGVVVEFSQWASLVPVTPIAKIDVAPEDFPFLQQVNAHDPIVVSERAYADPDGFPWRD